METLRIDNRQGQRPVNRSLKMKIRKEWRQSYVIEHEKAQTTTKKFEPTVTRSSMVKRSVEDAYCEKYSYSESRMQMLEGDPALAGYDFDRGNAGMPGAAQEARGSARAAKARERERKREEADQAELDRILAKIATVGMGSLTKAEKRWLEQATERRRRA